MKLTKLEPFILHVPVTRQGIADSSHQISHWGYPGVIIHTDTGHKGYGFSGTHAEKAGDRIIVDFITNVYGPLLIGEDPRATTHLWQKLYRHPPAQWIGRAGISHLALGAIDIALWDLKSKEAEKPLWQLLGGCETKSIEAYNTDCGWLNWSFDELVSDAKDSVERRGFQGIKMKVGSPNPTTDLKRIEAVRNAIGPETKLMVDANGKWDLNTATRIGNKFADYDILWFEEPIWYDDISGHQELAASITTPIALGEQLYSTDAFTAFINARAVGFCQPDVVRVAGITEWLVVADLASAHNLPVVSHVGDMMQVHLHLAQAHPATNHLEYIPWCRKAFTEPATVENGFFVTPHEPGAGTTFTSEAFEKYNVL